MTAGYRLCERWPGVGPAKLAIEDVYFFGLVPQQIGALQVNTSLAVVAHDILVLGEIRLTTDAR